jgi:hypothetical protein
MVGAPTSCEEQQDNQRKSETTRPAGKVTMAASSEHGTKKSLV